VKTAGVNRSLVRTLQHWSMSGGLGARGVN
jgi:hypothetical protein